MSQFHLFMSIVDYVSAKLELQTYTRYDANQGLIAVHTSQPSVGKYQWPGLYGST